LGCRGACYSRLENQYPTIPTVVAPLDPHQHIAYWRFLDETTINAIFDTFNFATGFAVMLNGELRIFTPYNYDIKCALMEKPRTFGGLQVEYTNPTFLAAMRESSVLNSATSFQSRLRFDDEIEVRTRGRFGKHGRRTGRMGVAVLSRHDASLQYLTIASHVVNLAVQDSKNAASRVLASLSSLGHRKDETILWARESPNSEPQMVPTFNKKDSY
jgi:hypothetical protein